MRDSVAPGRAGKGATAPDRDSGAAAPISDPIAMLRGLLIDREPLDSSPIGP